MCVEKDENLIILVGIFENFCVLVEERMTANARTNRKDCCTSNTRCDDDDTIIHGRCDRYFLLYIYLQTVKQYTRAERGKESG